MNTPDSPTPFDSGNNHDSMVTVPLSDAQSTPQTPAHDGPVRSDEEDQDRVEDNDDLDWAELEKTEEQEPRAGQSDEVFTTLFFLSDQPRY